MVRANATQDLRESIVPKSNAQINALGTELAVSENVSVTNRGQERTVLKSAVPMIVSAGANVY